MSALRCGVIFWVAWLFGWGPMFSACAGSPPKQASLDEWRALTSPTSPPPCVRVKGDRVRIYFPRADGWELFQADWQRTRVPTDHYRIASALLRWQQKLAAPADPESGWREARVIAGAEWREISTGLFEHLTPETPLHGAYYQAFFADGLFFRDAQGRPHYVPASEPQPEVTVVRRFSIEETLQALSSALETHLRKIPSDDSLFLILPTRTRRAVQPLLLDQKHRRCVLLSPAALYDTTDRGLTWGGAAEGLGALVFEGHGLALLKNPVSSAFRLVDLGLQTTTRFLRRPLPRLARQRPLTGPENTMDLTEWERWLDTYTGTRREAGSLKLLIDGEQFFPRLQQAIAAATNHVHLNVYIFDRDDVAVAFADQLRARATEIEVKVLSDRIGTLTAGLSPPATALPENFTMPASINTYLKRASDVRKRSFLNPWLSTDHSKVCLVDSCYAWMGGMNLGREYRYEWHDLMVELQGPVVQSLEAQFRADWAHAGPLGDCSYAVSALAGAHTATPVAASGDFPTTARLLPTRTLWKPMGSAVLTAIRRARGYIYVENPYLYDKKVTAAMVRARRRGVDVRVVLSRVNDFPAGARSNLVTANYLLAHGIRVYFYPGMTHVKALLVDDWALVGSGNLDHLSMRLCLEQNIATSDPDFAAQLKRDLFEADFRRSYELTEPISVTWMDFIADIVMENL